MDVLARDLQLPSLKMHLLTCGDPQKPLVVFLHGFPELSESWREILPLTAAQGFYAVAPDLRGYGGTDKPATGYDLDTLAQDIVELIAALGADHANVVGHDLGGAVAYHLAAFHPERVNRLSVVNCPHPAVFLRELWTPAQLKKSWYMGFFQLPWLPEWLLTRQNGALASKMIRAASVDKSRASRERLKPYADNFSSWQAARSGLAYYRSAARDFFGSTARRQRLTQPPKIRAPFHLVWCEEDVALGMPLSKGYEPYFEKPVEVTYLPKVGHFGMVEAPEVVGPAIVGHLRA
jgi:epoxide hydrolase 4